MCDLIRRQDAIDEIARWIGYFDEDMINRIQIRLKRLPSAQPERTGRWILHEDKNGYTYGECSECGMRQWVGLMKYCSDCGAKMEVEHE